MAKTKLSAGKKEEIKDLMLDFRKEAEDGNYCTFERMCQSERFKIGMQWDEEDITTRTDSGKFSLVINECLPIVLNVAGTEEQNPLDYTVRNVKGGTVTVADILSALNKNVMDKSNGNEEAGRTFEDGITNARGFLGADISYDDDPVNGDLVVSEHDPYMVLPDPTCTKYDYNAKNGGAKYIIVDEWIDKGKVEATYPRHKQAIKDAEFDLDADAGFFTGLIKKMCGGRNKGASQYTKDSYRTSDCDGYNDNNTTKQKFNYRKSTTWWKEWKAGVYVQNLDDPLNYISLTDPQAIRQAKDSAKATKIATVLQELGREEEAAEIMAQVGMAEGAEIPNIRVIDKDNEGNPLTVPVLNKTVMFGDVLVDHIVDPFNGVTLYPIARFAPYFDLGYEYSIVENLIGPQKMINYSTSTRANILKNLANSGYKVGGGSEPDLEWLEDHGSEDGIVINESNYKNKVEKIIQTPYPTGFDREVEAHKQNMREVAQIDLEAAPGTGGNESGRALAIRQAESIKTKGVIFRNWRHTNLIFARFLTEVIRFTDIFSDEEIGAILDDEDLIDDTTLDAAKGIIFRQIEEQGGEVPEPPEQPNPIRMQASDPVVAAEMLDKFQAEAKEYRAFIEQAEAAARPIAKDLTLKMVRQRQQGRYGVKIDVSPMSPTARMANDLQLSALNTSLINGGQAGISRDDLIDASDVSNKEKIKKNAPQVQQVA